MNLYENQIMAVRELSRGEEPHMDISKMLYDHKCYYLLSIMKDNKYKKKSLSERAIHQMVFAERYKACEELFLKLKDNKVPYAVVKGSVLSLFAYKNENVRISGDIDILINRTNVDGFKKCMRDCGFEQGRIIRGKIAPFSRKELLFYSAYSHQLAPFVKRTSNPIVPFINIDVNTNVLWGESKNSIDMSRVLSETKDIFIQNRCIRVLNPEMAFIELCLHHYKDMNSIFLLVRRSLKLSLFCDIYYYIQNTIMNINLLKQLCLGFNVSHYIKYCLFWVYTIFADDIIIDLFNKIDGEQYRELLNKFGLSEEERREWGIGFEERLLREDFSSYFLTQLSESELKKIRENQEHL